MIVTLRGRTGTLVVEGPAVAVVVLMRNEAKRLPELLKCLAALNPAPDQVVAVDGSSSDDSVGIAASAGLEVITCLRPGRAAGINAGVAKVWTPIVCILHADTLLPTDAVASIRSVLAEPSTALAGFTAILRGAGGVQRVTSFHNWIKTWYAPLLFHPILFSQGLRLLFGDHAMFFRRADFLSVGGCDENTLIMEDAELCIRLCRLGRVRLLSQTVTTSDRRVARWGVVRANWIFLRIGISWALGARSGLSRHYDDVR